jgi:hypothetical protein
MHSLQVEKGKRMKHLQIMIVAALVLFTATIALADEPRFNITGIWRSNDPGTAQVFQEGTDVRAIYINRGFSHFITAKYITPTTIKGIQYRQNRSNGCLTTMAITINVQSSDVHTGDWVGMDSNCDLREGQRGSWRSQRDKNLEASTWY